MIMEQEFAGFPLMSLKAAFEDWGGRGGLLFYDHKQQIVAAARGRGRGERRLLTGVERVCVRSPSIQFCQLSHAC